jgi:DNA-binding CsgD family transcriptional regulator
MTQQTEMDIKSTAILWLLSEGHSTGDILQTHPDLEQSDIAAAARVALDLVRRPRPAANYVEVVRKSHPQAYAPWTEEADAELAKLHVEGHSRAEIARRLGRRPNAIAKRIEKLKTEGAIAGTQAEGAT